MTNNIQDLFATKKQVYSVRELTKNIRTILEASFPEVWVEGEISNFLIHSSGHTYLTLKDEASSIKCMIFKGMCPNIKFKLDDGQKVVCFGRIGVYEKSGQYQLYIEKIEPKGLGALQLAFEQLKARLAKEGLFDEARKRPIPALPRRIGIVTSPTGAAIKDILNVLNRRFANLEIILNPVRVQGEGAGREIANAIEEFNNIEALSSNKIKSPDVLIVGRGGGSLEDLWAFNEEAVARAIFNSRIPVISAVGHEIDYTISDFVADLRAPTPSVAAELVTSRKEELKQAVINLQERLELAIFSEIDSFMRAHNSLCRTLSALAPSNIILQNEQSLDEYARSMAVQVKHFIQIKEHNLINFLGKLKTLCPLSILERGYSITLKLPEEIILKDKSQIKPGDLIQTNLWKGKIISRVENLGGGNE